MYCCQKDFINHIGNTSEMHSVIRGGLILGGRCLKRGRQSVFFTKVNPMEDDHGMEETPCDLTKPRIAPYTNTWKPLENTEHWCNWKLAQKRGLQFYQTRSHAIVLYNSLPAFCIEKAVCTKTKEELYHKICSTPRLQRVVLKANSHSGQQDQREQDARTSCDQPSEPKSSRKSWNNTVDNRIPGIPLLESNSRIRIANTRSRSWSNSSRATRTRNPSIRTWARRRRSISSAKNRRIWSPTRTTPRSSSFARPLPKSNGPDCNFSSGRSALLIALVEDV